MNADARQLTLLPKPTEKRPKQDRAGKAYRRLEQEVKRSCKTYKKQWFEHKASEAQTAAVDNL